MSTPIVVDIEVRWGDCDPAGIAFYPRFFEWMDVAATELHRLLGVKRIGTDLVRGLPLVEAGAQFLAPALVEDRLEVRTFVTKIGRTSLALRHEFVRKTDGVVLAKATERRVFVVREAGKSSPMEITEAMREALRPHLES